jgi:O-antigen ligase
LTQQAFEQNSSRESFLRLIKKDKLLFSLPVQISLFMGIGLVLAGLILGATILEDPKIVILVGALFLVLIVLRFIPNAEQVLVAALIVNAVYPIDINLFHRKEIQDLSGIPGLNISLTTILLFGLYVFWLVRKRDELEPVSGRLLLAAILPSTLFLLIVSISLAVATDRQATIFEIFMVFQVLLQHIYFVYNIRSEAKIKYVITILMLVVLSQAILMIYLYITQTNFAIATLETYGQYDGLRYRVGGTLGHANSAGGFLGLVMLPIFSVIFSKVDKQMRLLAVTTFIFSFIALIMTFSRGSWSGVISFVIVFVLISLARGWIRLPSLIMMSIPAGITISSFWGAIFGRLTQEDTSAFNDRLPLNDIAVKMIQDKPLFGFGANNYWLVLRGYAAELGGIWPRVVHNKYLLVASETGLLGLSAYVLVLLTALEQSWRYVRRDTPLSPLALGLGCGLLSNMLHMNVDIFNGLPQLQMLWLVVSLLYGINLMESALHDRPN